MDETQYVLWSASRGGWLQAGAFTTTELPKADRFTRAKALEMCKKHSGGNTMGLIPVDFYLLMEARI